MDDVLNVAARLLEEVHGRPARLHVVARLGSEHTLLRCRVDGAGTVLVKHAPDQRLANEVAALRSLAAEPGPWPRLVAAGDGVAVIQDLGELRSVEELLLDEGAPDVERCFPAMGEALAALHTGGAPPPPAAPRSDSTYDVRRARSELEDCFEVLGLAPPPGFWQAVADLEDRIHGPGPYRTFVHADAGPQNFLWTGAGARLVDYEFATTGHGFLDVVSARLGFPHSARAMTVPLRHVAALEDAYLAAAGPPGDVAAALTDAAAHWALVRWAGLWRRCFRDPGGDQGTMRAQALTVYRRFVATAATTGHHHVIATAVDAYTTALQRRFPGLEEMPPYPAVS